MNIITQPVTGREPITDPATPYAALVTFYCAFNNCNLELMATNWMQNEDCTMSNPLGGIKRGWREIKAVYERIFHGPAKVHVEFYDYSLIVTDNMFCAAGREKGVLEIGDEKIELSIRTSRVYVHHGYQWRQAHHHGSIDDPELLDKYQTTILHK